MAVGAGDPVAGVSVQVDPASGPGTYRFATTAADGSWSATGLQPGSYSACFQPNAATTPTPATGWASQCWSGKGPGQTPTTITVTAGATAGGIDAVLAEGAAVSGTVDGPDGQPLPRAEVEVQNLQTHEYASATAGADGSYDVTGLAGGTGYSVCFDGPPGGGASGLGYVGQCDGGRPAHSSPGDVTLTAGSTATGYDAALAAAGGLHGTVKDTSGAVVVGETVAVTLGSSTTELSTGPEGTYAQTALGPGSYTVCFTSTDGTHGSATSYAKTCTTATVQGGSSTELDVTLTPSG